MRLLRVKPVLQTWGRTLRGRVPSLSIEITKECPLRCPGCYAYEDAHLGKAGNLRSLADFKGQELIARVLDVVDRHRPLHLSIVGGDPLVRYRELEVLLPQLVKRTHVHVVTSAFRPLPTSWATLPNLQLVVSIDGLQPEHDIRRPATYERILRNIQGHHMAVHCTITSAMVKRDDYIPEFVHFWSVNPAVERIWISIFTPQRGSNDVECLTANERMAVVATLRWIRHDYPKLEMTEKMVKEFLSPPESPDRCIFAQTTHALSADFKTRVEPCQFGGDPDCSRCGCFASMGLAAVGHQKVIGPITAGHIFWASHAIGSCVQRAENALQRFVNVRQGREEQHALSRTENQLRVIN